MPTKLKPYNPSRNDLAAYWHVVDAQGQVLGRMATDIAVKLMGKHRPDYVPHMLSGDFVIVINADKVRVSGKKASQKVYRRHSGYPGNLKEVPYSRVMSRTPARIIEHAVRGMLPKNKLGNKAIRRLKVYAGPDHPHEAQVIGSERALERLEPVVNLDDIDLSAADQPMAEQPKETQPEVAAIAEPIPDESETMAEVAAPSETTPDEADETAEVAVDQVVEESEADASDEQEASDEPEEVSATQSGYATAKLSEIGVSARVAAALSAEGIETVADALGKTDDELLEIKGFGSRSLDELRTALAAAGHHQD